MAADKSTTAMANAPYRPKKRKKRPVSERTDNGVFKISVIILTAVFTLTYLLVFLWMILSSFRDKYAFATNPTSMFDFSSYTSQPYKNLFSYELSFVRGRKANIFQMLRNSLIMIAISVIKELLFGPVVGYVMSRYKFRGKKVLFYCIILTMTVPGVGSQLVYYKFVSNTLNLYDSWLVLIIPGFGGSLGFGVFIWKNFFDAIPSEYSDAAKVDGAGPLRIYFRIYYPLAKPLLFTFCILAVIGSWNDYMTSYLYLPTKPTIAYGINQIVSHYETNLEYPTVFAGLTVVCIVPLVFYAFFSKQIMSNLQIGGIKG